MGMTIWESALAEGRADGELRLARRWLSEMLEARFGSLPEQLKQQIDATTDLGRLHAAHQRALKIERLDELQW